MSTLITDLFSKREPAQLDMPNTRVGTLRYALGCDDYEAEGFNSAPSTGQVTRITFPLPGTLAPGGRVYLALNQPDCSTINLELHNCETTAVNLVDLLLTRINGDLIPSIAGTVSFNASDMSGYTAVAPATPVRTVDITGSPGKKFSIVATGFGLTIDGVATPAAPTITTITTAIAAGKVGYGLAIGIDPVAAGLAYPKKVPGLAQRPNKIISLPNPSPTWRFKGITIRNTEDTLPFLGDSCCEVERDCFEGYDCCDCVHYVHACCHPQEVLVQLEPFLPTSVIPIGGWEQAPVYYRKVANGNYTQRGALSIFPSPTDTSVAAAIDLDTNRPFVVTNVVSVQLNRVYIGLKGAV
jgi:hypothetical protein